MRVSSINLFPVKSCGGTSVPQAEVTARGLLGDRRWMLVDGGGRCVTQRDVPALALLQAQETRTGVRLTWRSESLEVPFPSQGAERLSVVVWDDALLLPEAASARDTLARWFEHPLRLVHQPDESIRPVAGWGRAGDHVSLADAFPILIATAASLDAVRTAAAGSFGMERFRPNLVVEGADPWAEDRWASLRIGDVELEISKPCARCTVTTVDQSAGVFAGEEPLATLRRIRMSGDRRVPGVLFGWNAIPRRLGTLRIGDAVQVLAAGEPWPIRATGERISADRPATEPRR